MTYQGSREIKLEDSPVTLSCISREARDLMDDILEQCPPDIRKDQTTDRFLTWLHGSGLIRTAFTVEQLQQADQQWCDRMAEIVDIKRQDVVYGCTYWLVRYSGMIEPSQSVE